MESKESNDLFFTCGLLEYIGRSTNNRRKYVTEKLGIEGLTWIYNNAQVLHCENILAVIDELVTRYNIEEGEKRVFEYEEPPEFWVGRTYSNLIESFVDYSDTKKLMEKTYEIMTSWLVDLITNFNSDLYQQHNGYLKACYEEGDILWD